MLLARYRVHEGLVDQEHASRPGECTQSRLGVQDAGGVGGIADDDQIGVVGHRCRVEPEVVPGVEQYPAPRVTGDLSATSGSVNCGCTTTGRGPSRVRAMSPNASAAPAVASTSDVVATVSRASAASAALAFG